MAIEYIKFYNPQITDENCVPLSASTIPPETTSTTNAPTTTTETAETETSPTDVPETEVPPNENPTCLRVDFNDSTSLPDTFQECDGQYLPGLIVKSYLNSGVTPYRSTSSNYLSNRWEGLSCLETTAIFSVNEASFIESVVYLNGEWAGAWIEISIVDVDTGEQELLTNLQIDNTWRLLSEDVKSKFSNARVINAL